MWGLVVLVLILGMLPMACVWYVFFKVTFKRLAEHEFKSLNESMDLNTKRREVDEAKEKRLDELRAKVAKTGQLTTADFNEFSRLTGTNDVTKWGLRVG